MAGRTPSSRLFRFGPFELEVRSGELRKHGIRIKLREQPVQILLMLLENPGEVVLRDEIRLRLWPNNTIVEFDHGINAAIQKLRDALGESADKPRYVETVARRGYRFLGEVERTGDLAETERTGEPVAEPQPEAPPSAPVDRGDLAGKVLSHYRILHKIGEGGMGVVYRAEDLKLGRHVALKFLPCAAGELPDAVLRRFEREARAASALNHPHICTIYGLEDVGGQPAIAMELVEGETLAARLAQGGLPLPLAVDLALQIADALAEAHGRGVVHRDLKPANIMLSGPRSRPRVKVLDFGLAKMEPPAPDFANGETVTERGALVGTLPYMSPEQVEGKEAGAQSDIFAFGLVLYEMATGKRAFESSSKAGMVAAILEHDPAPFEPERLNRVVRACLAKDPADRLQSARDIKLALEWSEPGGITTAKARLAVPAGTRRFAKWIPWAAAALLIVTVALVWLGRGPMNAQRRLALSIVPPPAAALMSLGENASAPEISPDGSSVLFASMEGLWVRRLDSFEPRLVPGSERYSNAAFWSADSKSVIFPAAPNLMRVRVPDGAPEVLSPCPTGMRGGSESDRGTVLYTPNPLVAVPSQGGKSWAVQRPGLKPGDIREPQFLPGSEDFLFLLIPDDGSQPEVYMASMQNGQAVNPTLLMKNDTAVRYTPAGGGRILFVRNDNLYSQNLDRTKRRLRGEAELFERGVASLPGFSVFRADFSVSRNGVVAWRPGRAALNQVTIFDRQGREIGTAGRPSGATILYLSPDESRLLAEGPSGPWLLTPGQPGSFSLGTDGHYFWEHDGSHLFGQLASRDLVQRTADGSKDVKVIGKIRRVVSDISPDGKHVLLGLNGYTLFTASLEGPAEEREPKALVQGKELLYSASFSPDGRWIAYTAGYKSGEAIYVQPFVSPGLRTQIASSDGMATWRGDGKEIVIADRRGVWSVRVDTLKSGLHFGAPELMFSGARWPAGYTRGNRPIAVSRDGVRIYFNQAVEQPDMKAIHVRMGW